MTGEPVDEAGAGKAVVVVGGGLAGISAALALAKQGADVTLLESKRRLGGRAGSFAAESNQTGEIELVDYCQHVGMGCCTNLQQLIRWLGQEPYWCRHRELHLYGPSGRYQRLAALPWLPAPYHLAGWLWRWPGLSLTDRISIARGMHQIRRLTLDDSLDRLSALEWLRRSGQTTGALDHFWSTIIVSALGEELSRVSLAATAKVLQDGFLNHRDAFHLLIPSRPLQDLFGSLALQELQKANVRVELGAAVTGVSRSKIPRVRVESTEQTYGADAVVLAVAWQQLPRLCRASQLDHLTAIASDAQNLQNSPITGVHTWWDRPWLDSPHATLVGRLCQWVFPKLGQKPHTGEAPPKNGPGQNDADHDRAGDTTPPQQRLSDLHYYQIVISASRSLPRGDTAKVAGLIRDDLSAVFPRVKSARLVHHKVVTDPHAVFSVVPGALQYRPATATPNDEFVLAGDWTKTGWPATMEGAIISGFRAAEQILHKWGRSVDLVCKPLGG